MAHSGAPESSPQCGPRLIAACEVASASSKSSTPALRFGDLAGGLRNLRSLPPGGQTTTSKPEGRPERVRPDVADGGLFEHPANKGRYMLFPITMTMRPCWVTKLRS